MAGSGSRGRRTLGTGTENRRSMNGKNGALMRVGGDIVHGGGGGNLALLNLVGTEGQGEREIGRVMH